MSQDYRTVGWMEVIRTGECQARECQARECQAKDHFNQRILYVGFHIRLTGLLNSEDTGLQEFSHCIEFSGPEF